MIRYLIFLILLAPGIASCHGKQVKDTGVIKDSTDKIASGSNGVYFDSTQIDLFLNEQKVDRDAGGLLKKFYEGNGYSYTWFSDTGINDITRRFWSLHNSYITDLSDTAIVYHPFHREIDRQINGEGMISGQKKLQTELEITIHFFVYVNHAYAGKADPAVMQWYIPRKKIDPVALLNSFISRNGKNLEAWEPVNILYRHLKQELMHYRSIATNGGWKTIPLNKQKTYKVGDSSIAIRQIRERLEIVTTENTNDTSHLYSEGLLLSVKSFQKNFGLKADGIITVGLINELNIPVQVRIEQILINLERMRWLPDQPQGTYIGVNIPEFSLHVFEGEKKLFSIDIVVGQAAYNTVIFADKLEYVVFSPYWNVPPSIVRKEILPAIAGNSNYLAKTNMEQTGYAGGLPVIRQKPGGENALGRVKFIFPNSYNIYFHGTPSKALFGRQARAFSHGCMRLAEPAKFATYLLRNQPEWTTEKMTEAMNISVEKWVKVKEAVPVYITYFTAWVDSDGSLNFRKDIYAHDKEVAKNLSEL